MFNDFVFQSKNKKTLLKKTLTTISTYFLKWSPSPFVSAFQRVYFYFL